MHGHAIRLLAEEEHIDNWTDFGPGAVYGAIKRLAVEGLIAEVRTERDGNYPERSVYEITAAGAETLDEIRRETLDTIVYRHDPFDLAMARLDPDGLDSIETVLQERLTRFRALQDDLERHIEKIRRHLNITEVHVMRHQHHRLAGEIAWHEELIANLPAIIDDEKSRKGR